MLHSALINVMVKAARRAGRSLKRDLGEIEHLQVSMKGPANFVTLADKRAEEMLYTDLAKARPGYGFIGEEGGNREGSDKSHTWIVDPLDGTTNFLHGFPVFSVSIACQHRGKLEHAVIYDPMRQEIFTASRGSGAHLDNHRIRVSKQRGLEGALVGTGFPYRSNMLHIDAYLAMMRAVMEQTSGIRRPGSAALDLAYVAAGRTDAFWEIGLKPWDTAAGTLLIQEAGGRVGTLTGGPYTQGGNIVAGSPKAYEALVELLAPHVTERLREPS
jgi:myo-inositol-1(or 4)-monophosphatase